MCSFDRSDLDTWENCERPTSSRSRLSYSLYSGKALMIGDGDKVHALLASSVHNILGCFSLGVYMEISLEPSVAG